jgi:AcrR family transcriptional regulator
MNQGHVQEGPPQRPLRRDAQRNLERILTSATEVFAERGLDATLDDVAAHAGVGVGTVYRRFADKEALVDVLFEQNITDLIDSARRALDIDDPWDSFTFMLRDSFGSQVHNRGLHEIMVKGVFGRNRVAAARERVQPAMAAVIDRAKRAGVLRADFEQTDVPVLAVMVGHAADYVSVGSPETWTRYLTILLDGLRAQPGPPSALPAAALSDAQFETAMATPRR